MIEAGSYQRYRGSGEGFDLLDETKRFRCQLFEATSIAIPNVDVIRERDRNIRWPVK